ncbi:MAG: succinate dehydrogenase [Actinomycetota bacterium]|nr:succinate dehydrogenase [Actinomycetota bacterium]
MRGSATFSWSAFTARFPWWAGSVTTVAILGAFTVYVLLVVFLQPEPADYGGYLLSPLYSPPVPSVVEWLSPAIFILWIPLGFRATCYYYRKAYYRAFFWDPPNCSSKAQQREPRSPENYRGERALFVLNNVHRYFLYGSIIVVAFLVYEAVDAFFPNGFPGGFGITLGSLLFLLNIILLSGYTFGCHSMRHLAGGRADCYSCVRGGNLRRKTFNWVSVLNGRHMFWAWTSLFSVWAADVYVRLLIAGVIPQDPGIWVP